MSIVLKHIPVLTKHYNEDFQNLSMTNIRNEENDLNNNENEVK